MRRSRRAPPEGTYDIRLTLLVACLATGCAGGGTAHAVHPHPTSGTVPRPDHVVVVVLENKSPARLREAPYIASLERTGAVFTNSYAVGHPSQPNYLALFSGSTQGVADDSCPHSFAAANLGSELRAAGLSFAGYSEGLPRTGETTCGAGRYARKHAPWVNFRDLPASVNRRYADLPRDFTALPTVAFVIPDLCNDMHDCGVATGDAWLRTHLGGYLRWARTHDSVLILTFDEDDRTARNKINTIFAGARVRPGAYADPIDHYSVLRTIQDAYRLPALGESARRSPITGPWTTNADEASTAPHPPFRETSTALGRLLS